MGGKEELRATDGSAHGSGWEMEELDTRKVRSPIPAVSVAIL
jgi:hypothetical protein